MVRCIGHGHFRYKRLIATDASRLSEWADGMPAPGTEKGYRVSAEHGTTRETFHRQYKPESLTAPSDEPILCVFTCHHRGSTPFARCACFFYGNVTCLSR